MMLSFSAVCITLLALSNQKFTLGITAYISPFDMSDIHFLKDFHGKLITLESMYCDSLCNFTFPLEAQYSIFCAQCNCDSLCEKYEDCCPDIIQWNHTALSNTNTDCLMSSMKSGNDSFMMVTSCADTWQDEHVRNNCTATCTGTKVDCYTPVTDTATGETYRNRFCAECSKVVNFVEWSTYAQCQHGDPIFSQAKSEEEILQHVLLKDTCNIVFKPPDDYQSAVRPCTQLKEIISECNVTGKWHHYDQAIEQACSLYTRVVKNTYKNMFCRLCNGDTWDDLISETVNLPAPTVDVAVIPLTALLQFGHSAFTNSDTDDKDVENENTSTCLSNQIFDNFSCQCREIYCDEGKYFTGNTCKSYISKTNHIGYKICFHIKDGFDVPVADHHLIPLDLHRRLLDIDTVIERALPFGIQLTKSLTLYAYVQQCGNHISSEVHSSFSFISQDVSETDKFQEYLIGMVDDIKHELENSLNVTVALRDLCQSENMEPRFFKSFPLFGSSIEFYLPDYLETIATGAKYTTLNRFLLCPHIVLKRADFQTVKTFELTSGCTRYSSNETRETDLIFNATGAVLKVNKYVLKNESKVEICVEDYEELVSELLKACTEGRKDSNGTSWSVPTSTTLGIVSLVCTCVSLFFLFLTFVMYCFLPELRTAGGVCNMGLIMTLFTAQILYEFGIEQYEDVVYCKVIGILIHFFWLAAIMWTNACVIQFFYRLSFPIRSVTMTSSIRVIFLVSAVYSYGISLLIVSLTILSHHYVYGDVGYGGNICYLNTFYGTMITFFVPVGLVTVANLIMFITTVTRLSCRKSPTCSKAQKVGFFACVRLSTMAGLSWLFGYLYTATSIDVFAYVFTLLVGLQGLSLFLALMVNRHVLSLLKEKFKVSAPESQVRSVHTTTL